MKDYTIYKLNDNLAYVLIKRFNALNKDIKNIEKDIASKYSLAIIDNLLTVGKYSSNRFYLIAIKNGKFIFDKAIYSKDILTILKNLNIENNTEIIIKKVNRNLNRNKDLLEKSGILRFQ